MQQGPSSSTLISTERSQHGLAEASTAPSQSASMQSWSNLWSTQQQSPCMTVSIIEHANTLCACNGPTTSISRSSIARRDERLLLIIAKSIVYSSHLRQLYELQSTMEYQLAGRTGPKLAVYGITYLDPSNAAIVTRSVVQSTLGSHISRQRRKNAHVRHRKTEITGYKFDIVSVFRNPLTILATTPCRNFGVPMAIPKRTNYFRRTKAAPI